MKEQRILPIGIESFEKLRRSGFYYVDKTKLIEDLLSNWGEVNLFTRPRRFGKSLNMSMLKNFFEIGCDPQLFDGLYISSQKAVCEVYMGKFPVISLSLKKNPGIWYYLSSQELPGCLYFNDNLISLPGIYPVSGQRSMAVQALPLRCKAKGGIL